MQEEQQAIAKAPKSPAPWEPRYNREERRVFYHNPTTHERCWTIAEAIAAIKRGQKEARQKAAAEAAKAEADWINAVGFAENKAREVLRRANGDTHKATEILITDAMENDAEEMTLDCVPANSPLLADAMENDSEETTIDDSSSPSVLSTAPPSFAKSEFKRAYEATAAPKFQDEVFGSVRQLLKAHCAAHGIADSERDTFFSQLQNEAFNHPGELLGEVEAVAQRLWTSAKTLQSDGRELCSIMNAAVRSEDPALCGPVAVLARAINRLVVTRRVDSTMPFPPGGTTVRGGGLPDEHRDFFTPGKRFRSPGFLATSFSEDKAYEFWFRAHVESKLPAVKWVVHVDPRGETSARYRCKHVNLVTKTNVPGEQEYLFAPYSVFTVRSVQFSESADDDDPHIIELDAAVDNRKEPEDLPTAPWA